MGLTKKRMALLTVLMTGAFFFLLMLLPESVIGDRGSNVLLFVPKIAFLSMTAAIATDFLLILAFKRNFVKVQLSSYNRFKHLLRLMVKRDFQIRYRKSFLGILWSLLNPLMTMVVMTVVFSLLFEAKIPNYPVYLLSGQITYGFFTEATTRSMGSVIANESIIKKVYVPKYIFPLSNVLSSLVNLAFSLLSFLIVFVVTRAPYHATMLLIPIPIVYIFVFSLGVALLLSSMTVFFRDLTYLYGIFTTLLSYLTPLFYPASIVPEWAQPFMGLNPIYHFVSYFRSLALEGVVPGLWENIVCVGFALAALSIGAYVFVSKQDKYILYL